MLEEKHKGSSSFLLILLGIFIGVAIMFLIGFISDSNPDFDSPSVKLLGTWQTFIPINGVQNLFTFSFDKNASTIIASETASVSGKYEIKGSSLTIFDSSNQTISVYTYQFITDNSLSLIQSGQNLGIILTRLA